MSALEILLLRHAQSLGNEEGRFGGHGPTPLTAQGRAQAEATARALAREGGLTAIVSSDLVRAVQTAQLVSEATGVDVVTTPELRERSVGIFTGLTFAEAADRHPEAYAAMMRRDPNSCPPEGETQWQCSTRAGACFDRALLRHAEGRLLFVSHAFTINLVLRRLFGLDDTQFFQTDNCALHRLKRRRDNGWTVVALNDRAHLVELG
jgi:2,3-bisphosphoglycerate-dependent phosphoglycerate mutase